MSFSSHEALDLIPCAIQKEGAWRGERETEMGRRMDESSAPIFHVNNISNEHSCCQGEVERWEKSPLPNDSYLVPPGGLGSGQPIGSLVPTKELSCWGP